MSVLRPLRVWATLAVLTAGLLGSPLHAQPRRSVARKVQPQSDAQPAQPSTSSRSLAGRLGMAVTERLLSSHRRDDRLRAIQMLGAQRDLLATQRIVRALEDNAAMFGDGQIRLEVVRALVPFAARDPARSLLIRFVVDDAATAAAVHSAHEAASLAREQAAMALASADDVHNSELLAAIIAGGADGSDVAAKALISHPPSNLAPLLSPQALSSERLVQLLGVLGDMRAIPKLREVLSRADLAVRAAAAVSLTRLGDEYALKTVRDWSTQPGSTPTLREAAAQALVLVRAVDAPRAVAVVLAEPTTRASALRLAFDAPTPQLSASLAGYTTIATATERPLVLLALARSGAPVAYKTIETQLGSLQKPDSDAIFALAHCRGDSARSLLAKIMLGVPSARRMAVRASLVRHQVLSDPPDDLDHVLRALLGSSDATDRELGSFGLAVTGAIGVDRLVAGQDLPRVRGACRATWALGHASRLLCAKLLNDRSPAELRDAAAVALGDDVLPDGVSTNTLLEWSERSEPLSSLFARALGSRDSQMIRPRLRQLLSSGDPILRAQVALGLAHSPEPSAVGVLIEAFRVETDPLVRRAIVRALSATNAPQCASVLKMAISLDGDEQVRELAQQALRGAHLNAPVMGSRMAWIKLDAATSDGSSVQNRQAVIVPPTAFAVAGQSDGDGFLLVPGLPPGEIRVAIGAAAKSARPPSTAAK